MIYILRDVFVLGLFVGFLVIGKGRDVICFLFQYFYKSSF